MKVLVLGGTGATGSKLIKELIKKDISIITVVRDENRVPEEVKNSELAEIINGQIHSFTDDKIDQLIGDCDYVISCLGHNLSLKGMFGYPQHLVTDIVKKICKSISRTDGTKPKFILMSTTGKINKKEGEIYKGAEKIVFSLLYLLLPPHRDNMLAADYLVKNHSEDNSIEWVTVRPDSLINNDEVTEYEVFNTLQRSSLSDPGKTSRINVGNFMARLVTENELWEKWKYKMPVIYNK